MSESAQPRYEFHAATAIVAFFVGGLVLAMAGVLIGGVALFVLGVMALACLIIGAWLCLCSAFLVRGFMVPKLIAAAGIGPGCLVLDFGTQRGLLAIETVKTVKQTQALGIAYGVHGMPDETLELARENAQREGVTDLVQFRPGDLRALALPEASFDAVISSGALPTFESDAARAAALAEALRVLRPGGRFAICDQRAWRYAAPLTALGAIDVRVDWSLLPLYGNRALVSARKRTGRIDA